MFQCKNCNKNKKKRNFKEKIRYRIYTCIKLVTNNSAIQLILVYNIFALRLKLPFSVTIEIQWKFQITQRNLQKPETHN